MAGFTESALSKKLNDLNASQQSIQTLSLWLIHHRKHYPAIVKMWASEISKGDESRQLTLMYLANDVIQNSRKKGPEFNKEFAGVLRDAFEVIGSPKISEKTRKCISRLLQVWEERSVYDKKLVEGFTKAFENIREQSPPPRKKSKSSSKEKKKQQVVEVHGMKEVHVTLSPQAPVGDPPEPEELIKALLELENSASSDAAIREKIASLPPEVSEVSLLLKLEDKTAAERLSVQVNDAVELLTEYNTRLVNEMEDRRKVTQMLHDFIQSQRDLLLQAQSRLEEYEKKLISVKQVRREMKSHIRNLPDLTQLPDVTGGLAPLPSAGDLFRLP